MQKDIRNNKTGGPQIKQKLRDEIVAHKEDSLIPAPGRKTKRYPEPQGRGKEKVAG